MPSHAHSRSAACALAAVSLWACRSTADGGDPDRLPVTHVGGGAAADRADASFARRQVASRPTAPSTPHAAPEATPKAAVAAPEAPPAWATSGFSVEDAKAWASHGFAPLTARGWRARGFSPAWARHCTEGAGMAPGALQAEQVARMRCAFPIGLVLPGLSWEMSRAHVQSALQCQEHEGAILSGGQDLSCRDLRTALFLSAVPVARFWFSDDRLESVRLSLKEDAAGDISNEFENAARALAALIGEPQRISVPARAAWNTTTLRFGELARMQSQTSADGKILGSSIDLLNPRDRPLQVR